MEHGLASSSLYQWIHPKRKRGTTSEEAGKSRKRKRSQEAAFTEVSVVGQVRTHASAMTVALRGGHSVTFEGAPVDPAWLGSVLRVVSAC